MPPWVSSNVISYILKIRCLILLLQETHLSQHELFLCISQFLLFLYIEILFHVVEFGNRLIEFRIKFAVSPIFHWPLPNLHCRFIFLIFLLWFGFRLLLLHINLLLIPSLTLPLSTVLSRCYLVRNVSYSREDLKIPLWCYRIWVLFLFILGLYGGLDTFDIRMGDMRLLEVWIFLSLFFEIRMHKRFAGSCSFEWIHLQQWLQKRHCPFCHLSDISFFQSLGSCDIMELHA